MSKKDRSNAYKQLNELRYGRVSEETDSSSNYSNKSTNSDRASAYDQLKALRSGRQTSTTNNGRVANVEDIIEKERSAQSVAPYSNKVFTSQAALDNYNAVNKKNQLINDKIKNSQQIYEQDASFYTKEKDLAERRSEQYYNKQLYDLATKKAQEDLLYGTKGIKYFNTAEEAQKYYEQYPGANAQPYFTNAEESKKWNEMGGKTVADDFDVWKSRWEQTEGGQALSRTPYESKVVKEGNTFTLPASEAKLDTKDLIAHGSKYNELNERRNEQYANKANKATVESSTELAKLEATREIIRQRMLDANQAIVDGDDSVEANKKYHAYKDRYDELSRQIWSNPSYKAQNREEIFKPVFGTDEEVQKERIQKKTQEYKDFVNDTDRSYGSDVVKSFTTSFENAMDVNLPRSIVENVAYFRGMNPDAAWESYQNGTFDPTPYLNDEMLSAIQNDPNNQNWFKKAGIDLASSAGTNAPGYIASAAATLATAGAFGAFGGIASATEALAAVETARKVGNTVGAVTLGMQMFGSAYNEARENGHDLDESNWYALEQGLEEFATDKILGVAGGLGGSVVGNSALVKTAKQAVQTSMKKPIGKLAVRALAILGASGMSEYAQEFLQYYTENLSKEVFLNERSFAGDALEDFEQANYAGIIGFLNALLMGGAGTVAGEVGTLSAIGANSKTPYAYASLMKDVLIDLDESHFASKADYLKAKNLYDLLAQYENTVQKGVEPSNLLKGMLEEALYEYGATEYSEAYKQTLEKEQADREAEAEEARRMANTEENKYWNLQQGYDDLTERTAVDALKNRVQNAQNAETQQDDKLKDLAEQSADIRLQQSQTIIDAIVEGNAQKVETAIQNATMLDEDDIRMAQEAGNILREEEVARQKEELMKQFQEENNESSSKGQERNADLDRLGNLESDSKELIIQRGRIKSEISNLKESDYVEKRAEEINASGTSATVRVASLSWINKTKWAKKLVASNAQKGINTILTFDDIEVLDRNGDVMKVNGFVSDDGKTIGINVADMGFTAEQLNGHEMFHRAVKQNPHLMDDVRKKLQKYTNAELEDMAEQYAAQYGYLAGRFESTEDFHAYVLEEIYADIYAGMYRASSAVDAARNDIAKATSEAVAESNGGEVKNNGEQKFSKSGGNYEGRFETDNEGWIFGRHRGRTSVDGRADVKGIFRESKEDFDRRRKEIENLRNGINAKALKSVSLYDQGFNSVDPTSRNIIVPVYMYTADMKAITQKNREMGVSTTFVMGAIKVIQDGKHREVSGLNHGDETVVRVDNLKLSIIPISRHETFHARNNKANIEAILDELFSDNPALRLTPSELEKIIDAYDSKYNLFNNLSGLGIRDQYLVLYDEVFADAYAGVNAFEGKDSNFDDAFERLALCVQRVTDDNFAKGNLFGGEVDLEANEITLKSDVKIDFDTESASPMRFSKSTWDNSTWVTNRDESAKELSKALGVSVKKAKAYIDTINSVSMMIASDLNRLDYADTGLSAFVSNAEYGGSFDFTTLCKKRRLLTGTFSAIQRALSNSALTADEILEIRKMMDEKGLEVSCGKCYVEGSRASMGLFAKEFQKLYAKYYPNNWQPTMVELNTPDGVDWMRVNHPEAYEQYDYFWNHYGTLREGDPNLFASQQKPKLYQMRTAYKDEIIKNFNDTSKIEEKNRNGGVRLQSFSDFEIVHLIDAMQVIMDMSKVGLAGQAYTKVPEFALALGNTGLKINLSIDAWGVDENGNLIFNDKEGMPHETAFELRKRYSKNVGTICCVYDDAQLLAALKNPQIDFIIPFHRSQWKKAQYGAMGLPKTTKDYTYQQNEKWLNPKEHTHIYRDRVVNTKCTNYMPNEYWDFSKSGKENAEYYLEMCAKDGKRPKFYKFLNNNGDGSYSLKADGSTDGYWKLLIDFKMYDNNGKGSPQMAVRPDFNMDEVTQMLNDYEGGAEKFPVAQGIVDEFVDKYKKSHKGMKFSKATDSEGNLLTAMQEKYFADSKVRDANGNLVLVYHGSPSTNITSLSKNKIGTHASSPTDKAFWFTSDEQFADGMSYEMLQGNSNLTYKRGTKGKVYPGYLKMTNPFDFNHLTDEMKEILYEYAVETKRDDGREKFMKNLDEFLKYGNHQALKMYLDYAKIQELGYDGVIARIDTFVNNNDALEYGVFNSNQFKSQDNQNPTSNDDIRFSKATTPEELDEKYLKAVSKDKLDTAQKMVDRVAKANGYKPVNLYHGSESVFTEFNPGRGIFLTNSKEMAEGYGEQLYKLYIKLNNPLVIYGDGANWDEIRFRTKEIKKIEDAWNDYDERLAAKYERLEKKYWEDGQMSVSGVQETNKIVTWAKNHNYDGVIFKDIMDYADYDEEPYAQDVYVAFDPNQVKSAEPVTYDDNGEVIPLSKRFDSREESPVRNDVRFSKATERNPMEELENRVGVTEGAARRYASLLDSSPELREASEKLTRALKATNYSVVKEDVKTIAKEIMDYVGSNAPKSKVTNMLADFYQWIHDQDRIDGAEVTRLANEIADLIVKDSAVTYDMDAVQLYNNFRTDLKHYKIAITPSIIEAFGDEESFKQFRKENMNTIQFATKGTDIDTVYTDLARDYGLDLDVNPGADQMNAILDKLVALEPTPILEGEDYDLKVQEVSNKIYDAYFNARFNAIANVKDARAFVKEYNDAFNAFKQKERERNDAYYQKLKDKNNARFIAYQQRTEERIGEARKYNDKQSAKKTIISDVKTLSRWLLHPTDKQHIPNSLRQPLANFLSYIDFSNDWKNQKGEDTKRTLAWRELKDAWANIEKAQNEGESDGYYEIDPDIVAIMEALSSRIQTMQKLDDLTYVELRELRDVIKSMKYTIENANRMIASQNNETIQEVGKGSMADLNGMREHRNWVGFVGNIKNLIQNQMLSADTRFHLFGEWAEKTYKEVREGFNTKVKRTQQAVDYMTQLKEELGITEKEIREWGNEKAQKITITTTGGKEISLRPSYVMSLYELWKRPESHDHITEGGVVTRTVEQVGKHKEVVKTAPVKLTESDIKALTDKLTETLGSDKWMQFADGIAKFFQTTSEWGNNASMLMFGYRKFNDKHYFPIKVDTNSTHTKSDGDVKGDQVAIKDAGFTKEVVKKAKNPIIISDIVDVFTDVVNGMSNYEAFLAPMSDLLKWFNYKDENGVALKDAIERAYGKDALRYVKKLISDINGYQNVDSYFANNLIGRVKGSSVGANLSVAIQQPTAYARALAVMDAKYLIKGLSAKKATVGDWADVCKYSMIAQWKSWGFYETDIGRSMRSILTDSENLKDVSTKRDFMEWLNTKQMTLAEKGDEIAWMALWKASEAQVEDTTDLEVGSEEFKKEVARVFDNIIDRTQVVDSLFSRADVMRNKDSLSRMATSFMNEPMKSYNSIAWAMFDATTAKDKTTKAKAQKMLTSAVVGWLISQTLAAATKSFISALRDKDKEKKYLDRWTDAFIGDYSEVKDVGDVAKEFFGSELIGNLNPISYVPFLKDLMSLAQGYDVSRMDVQGFTAIIDSVKRWFSGNYSIGSNLIYSMKAVSNLTGIAVSNLLRDFDAIITEILYAVDAQAAIYHKERLTGKKIEADPSTYATMALKAYSSGNTSLGDEIVQDMIDAGASDKSIIKAVGAESKKDENGKTISGSQKKDFVEKILKTSKNSTMAVQAYKTAYPKDTLIDDWIKDGYNGSDYLVHWLKIQDKSQDEVVEYIKRNVDGIEKQKYVWQMADYQLDSKKDGVVIKDGNFNNKMGY